MFTKPFYAIKYISICFFSYCIYNAGFGIIDPQRHLAIFLGFSLVLVFLTHPIAEKTGKGLFFLKRGIDYILIAFGAWVGLYIIINFSELTYRAGMPTRSDIIMGIIATFMVIEMARRTIGNTLPILACFSILYALFGRYFPQPFTHAGVSIERFFSFMYLTFSGIFAIPFWATSYYIALFVLWGSLLEGAGVTNLFMNLANWLTGRSRGGPAKTAVLASGMMGMISGSGMANVVTTGVFTIPVMKKIGYKPYFAGAVEASASTGGQIMPPIMGASAFLMAEILGIPYIKVALFALLPALLYFFSIFVSVDIKAANLGLKPLTGEEASLKKGQILKYAHFALSPIILIFSLAVMRFSLPRTGFWEIISVILLSLIRKETRMSLSKITDALQKGILSLLPVAAACACSGIILGVINMTGLGLRLSAITIDLAGNNLFYILIMTMIVSLILGMGLPTTACYLLLAVVAAPTIIKMGINPIAAHMFVFYFGIMSTITPPIGLAAYAAAGIAGAPPLKTAFTSVRISLPAFIMPFMFIYAPSILLQGNWQSTVFDFIKYLITFHAFSCTFEGFLFKRLNVGARGLLLIAVLMMIFPSTSYYIINLLGFVIVIAVYFVNYRSYHRVMI